MNKIMRSKDQRIKLRNQQIIREFDPGSGETLAAHIRHASRTEFSRMFTLDEDLVADW